MTLLFSWLSRPYYFNHSKSYKLLVSLGFGIFVFLFLAIFKPFGVAQLGDNITVYSFGFGVLTTFGLLLSLFLLPLIFKKKFESENWTIGKNVLFTIWIIVLISSFNWYYKFLVVNDYSGSFNDYISFLNYTVAVGIFPSILFFIIDEKKSRKKREKIAEIITKEKKKTIQTEKKAKTISLTSDNKKDVFEIDINNLVYITSEGNYVCVFTKKNGQLKENILRTTLTKIYSELSDYNHMIRCHKSYIINSNHIREIRGNARGYTLQSSSITFPIPVSRSFPKESLKNLIG